MYYKNGLLFYFQKSSTFFIRATDILFRFLCSKMAKILKFPSMFIRDIETQSKLKVFYKANIIPFREEKPQETSYDDVQRACKISRIDRVIDCDVIRLC